MDIQKTDHGDSIADQIIGEDAYGNNEPLNAADLWHILDAMHTNFLDNGQDELMQTVHEFMGKVEKQYPDIDF